MTDAPAAVGLLTGSSAGQVLSSVLAAVGATLHGWDVRSVHQRGSSSAAVLYEVDLTDGRGHRRDRLYAAHVSTRPVPAGAAELDVDGARVHVWQFPHDPYLPGLPAAVHRGSARELLERLGLGPLQGAPAIRTRSYRPTRRAVVELRPGPELPPTAYVKLLGGRTADRIGRRTAHLVAVHEALEAAAPVPPVLEHDLGAGRVVLGALPGATLRTVLRRGDRLPDPTAVRMLLHRLHTLPAPPDGADPDAFADVSRHVALLRPRLPERAAALDAIAAVTAAVGGPRGTVHGDLHDGQLLVVDGSVSGVLDLDGAGTGLVAHDVGRLLAHLEASVLAVPSSAARAVGYVRELRGALADLAPPADVAAAAAAAWVGLATGPVRVASPSWRAEVVARIDRATSWAEQVS